ncbi:hypothetical protein PR003_g9453 [Phytophthora rubi]|uniref:rRNA-processing protein FYV7 n=1 Tax=Phytophthora rubi TaxID=129364 RepID=A0A6A3MTG9_9STRA|nr:hypothetical protein PR002_g9130 [Phytophthora rubi]KAE9041981.1 hypothetical protein PR001_g6388 [Phytophthora rubi]KAE9342473.1 hypothetical protein PR003_g9453 [Phytophthora rubi]
MRGSGLSIERFIKGKAQRSKSDAKSKKKVIIHKAQRRRQYEKVKKREESAAGDAGAGSSFYDRFFSELKSGNVDEDTDAEQVQARVDRKQQQEREEKKRVVKPDPFFKAKKKAEVTKVEKQRVRGEKQKRIATVEKKVTQRKKRHVKLSQRTATGQPVVKNHINDILSRLQAEKKREGK